MKKQAPHSGRVFFETKQGQKIPAVTGAEMKEIDRIAELELGLAVLQMMENAGRNLALHAVEMLGSHAQVLILAGPGGNGGGGLASMRHLLNHGVHTNLILSRAPQDLRGAAAAQYRILKGSGVDGIPASSLDQVLPSTGLIIDSLIGYSLHDAPGGPIKELIEACNRSSLPVLSLDIPSGFDATSGERPGAAVSPTRTLTLALPKLGLRGIPGRLFLCDIGIPSPLYKCIGVDVGPIFDRNYCLELYNVSGGQA